MISKTTDRREGGARDSVHQQSSRRVSSGEATESAGLSIKIVSFRKKIKYILL